MSPEDIARRRAAKRFNERLKLFATFLNNSGIAIFVGAFVLPLATGGGLTRDQALAISAGAVVAHIVAQLSLTLFRSED